MYSALGVQVLIYSPSGELLAILSDQTENGEILAVAVRTRTQGGVEEFGFSVERSTKIPFSRNTECFIYVDGELWFSGFLSDIPEPDQDSPELRMVGSGFIRRLDKKIANIARGTDTLSGHTAAIFSAELGDDVGVYWNASKVSLPALSGVSLEFKDKPLRAILDQLVMIANYDYNDTKYRYYVDDDRDLVIEEYAGSVCRGIFEGYQYQNPTVEVDNTRLRNKVLVYRTDATDKNALDYVGASEDAESQDRNGLFEGKLVVPDYLSDADALRMGSAIVERRAYPQKRVGVEDLVVSAPLEHGLYLISNRRERYWVPVNDCETISGWDLSNLSTASVTADDEHVLTGRRALRFSCNNSTGEYAQYTLSTPIPLPQVLRAFAYFDTTPIAIRITFFDCTGAQASSALASSEQSLVVNVTAGVDEALEVDSLYGGSDTMAADVLSGASADQWLLLEESIRGETAAEGFRVNPGTGEDDMIVNVVAGVDEDFEVRNGQTSQLFDVCMVRVTIESSGVAAFWLDNLDTLADVFKTAELILEEAEYRLSATRKTASASFGDREDSIVDEIGEQVKNGDVALAIFAAQ
jgi:hypothetical protein